MRDYRARHKKPSSGVKRRGTEPTARQLEVLRTYVDPELGGTQARTAAVLGISTPAVHNSLGHLMKRLGVKTPAQAAFKLWVDEGNEVPAPPAARQRPSH
jgi:DNA-binding CsgD family transcriptional regulator